MTKKNEEGETWSRLLLMVFIIFKITTNTLPTYWLMAIGYWLMANG